MKTSLIIILLGVVLLFATCENDQESQLVFKAEKGFFFFEGDTLKYNSKEGYQIETYRIDYGEEYKKNSSLLFASFEELLIAQGKLGFEKVEESEIYKKRAKWGKEMERIRKGNGDYILTDNYQFHPFLKKTNTFVEDEMQAFLNGLNSSIGEYAVEPHFCYAPKDAILLKDKDGKVVSCIEICFECTTIEFKPEIQVPYTYLTDKHFEFLRKFLDRLK